MTVRGHPDDFFAAVLESNERSGDAGRTLDQPRPSCAGRAIDSFLGQGKQFPVKRKKIKEPAVPTSAIARHPGAASAGGVFDVSVGRIDPDQFRSERD